MIQLVDIYYKLDYDNDWTLTPHKKSKVNITQKNLITPPYKNSIPIIKRKFSDLQNLKKLLPQDYQNFCDQLKVESNHEELFKLHK